MGYSPSVRLGMQIAFGLNVHRKTDREPFAGPGHRTAKTFTPMVVRCYTPVAPLGLSRGGALLSPVAPLVGLSRRGWCAAIHLSPLWG